MTWIMVNFYNEINNDDFDKLERNTKKMAK